MISWVSKFYLEFDVVLRMLCPVFGVHVISFFLFLSYVSEATNQQSYSLKNNEHSDLK